MFFYQGGCRHVLNVFKALVRPFFLRILRRLLKVFKGKSCHCDALGFCLRCLKGNPIIVLGCLRELL